mgnify:CR=1
MFGRTRKVRLALSEAELQQVLDALDATHHRFLEEKDWLVIDELYPRLCVAMRKFH